MFVGRSHPTWISVEPLPSSAVWSLVSKTLHRTKEDCAPLSQWIFAASSGNPFSARNILMTLQRQRHVRQFKIHRTCTNIDFLKIIFDWERNHWKCGSSSFSLGQNSRHLLFRYDIIAIKESLDHQKISDPTDLTFLITHLRELHEEARKYLIWAAFFGET